MTHIDVPERFTAIEGTVRNADGTESEFTITADGFSQWGADHFRPAAAWDLLKAIETASAGYIVDEETWNEGHRSDRMP